MAKETLIQKRKRSANWDDNEKNLLRECLKDVLHITENKCTDTNTNKAKSLAWQKVMKSFNEINGRERSRKELKQQWQTMKMIAKKCDSAYKKALKATGGGMKPPIPDPQTVKIMEMLPQEFEKDVNIFDSDTLIQQSILGNEIMPEAPLNIKKDVIKDQNTPIQESCPGDSALPMESTPVTSKQCKRKALGSLRSTKRRNCRFENETVDESIIKRNTAVLKLMQAEHDLKIKHMTEAHAWAHKEHELKCKNLKLKNLLLQKQLEQ